MPECEAFATEYDSEDENCMKCADAEKCKAATEAIAAVEEKEALEAAAAEGETAAPEAAAAEGEAEEKVATPSGRQGNQFM